MKKEKTFKNGNLLRKREQKIINYRMITPDQERGVEIFDLIKLKQYPLRLLEIIKNDENKKLLQFSVIRELDVFSNRDRYVLIGDANRTSISKEFIVTNPAELYEAIKIYIIKALTRRFEPLGYFLVGLDKIYELRPYKRMLKSISPLQISE